jgi:hypothetical protein
MLRNLVPNIESDEAEEYAKPQQRERSISSNGPRKSGRTADGAMPQTVASLVAMSNDVPDELRK